MNIVSSCLQGCYFILYFTVRWEFTPKPEFHLLTSHTQLSHGRAYGHSGAVASNSLQCIETRIVLSHRSDLLGPVMSPLDYRTLKLKVLFQLPQPFLFEHAWHDLTFRHRASSILGQAFRYSPENAFCIFNQQIYFIIWYLLDRASLI